MAKMSAEQIRGYHAIDNWMHHPSITTFKKLYHDGFRYHYRFINPVYRTWRILWNTASGRYMQILKQGYI
jgi:hypothetical protein